MALPNEFERGLIVQLRRSCKDVLKEMESDPSDMFLVRWLRAKNYDMKKAEQMIRENGRWKEKHEVTQILDKGLDTFFKLNYPLHMGIFDKRRRPVVVLPMGRWNLKVAVGQGLSTRFQTYIIQCMEAIMKNVELRDSLRKPCAMPITQFTVLLDFEGFQTSQLLDLRVLRFIHQTVAMLTANYPGSVADSLCINCPLLVAKSIQRLLNPTLVMTQSSGMSKYRQNRETNYERVDERLDELSNVLTKFIPESEVEKCLHLLSTE